MPSSVLLLGEEDYAASRFLKLPLVYFSGFGSRIEAWRREYNEERPHSAIGNLTPMEFIRHHHNQLQTGQESTSLAVV
ncbi:MAG: transposase [Nitrospira sp.]|nr:transposase [Nitrospira sp.]